MAVGSDQWKDMRGDVLIYSRLMAHPTALEAACWHSAIPLKAPDCPLRLAYCLEPERQEEAHELYIPKHEMPMPGR